MTTGTHYDPKELSEFEMLINQKLDQAESLFRSAVNSLARLTSNSTDDTYAGGSSLDECGNLLEREELTEIAHRQEKFILQLRQALARIKHGEYGICQVSGQLIPKERLRLVPHTTMCVEAKSLHAVHH